MKESDMFMPIRDWLKSKGAIKVCTEIYLYDTPADIVALMPEDKILVIEMKKSLTKHLIRQAHGHYCFSNYTYIAVATKPRMARMNLKCNEGIGVLSVKDNKVLLLRESEYNDEIYAVNYKDKEIIDLLKQMPEGEESGLPTQKGDGTAKATCRRIIEYLEIHPNATWKEIYKDVPSHYSNYKSMQNSMRQWCGFTL